VRRPARAVIAAAVGLVATLALAGCVPNSPTGVATASGAITVTSTATACSVSSSTAPSGTLSFAVTNAGTEVTEFYLLADDGERIIGEVENVGPGITRTLAVQASPGRYFTVCKPGMLGAGVGRAAFTVTTSGKALASAGKNATQVAAAAANYVAYLRKQVQTLVTGTDTFLSAYRAGDDAKARRLYAITRSTYERIEPVAESFGALDSKLDFREADVPKGTEWTGWHRIEKDLFPPAAKDNGGKPYLPLTKAQRIRFADLLEKDTAALSTEIHQSSYTLPIDAISNGAISLMDEVASGKITGEEEVWSHTDLWDFQGNLEGAKVAFDGLRDIIRLTDPALVTQIDTQFAALQALLATHGTLRSGFTYYDKLSTAEVKALSDGVNALAEPLSRLTGALVQ
jgi:iron uptake system component EfeO